MREGADLAAGSPCWCRRWQQFLLSAPSDNGTLHWLTQLDEDAAWTALETVHAPKSTVRKVQLRTAFASLKQGTAESATAYINRAKALRDDLAAAGHSTTSEDLANQVLAGLSPDYTMVKAIIENTTTAADLDVDDILPRLLPYERGASSNKRTSRNTDTAFMAHPSRPGPILSRRPGFTFPNTDNLDLTYKAVSEPGRLILRILAA
ncbi:hypothetical protein COHA_010853 [Chlorella ohadii]|uniref:Uncharacterized protein n=1 Tax=Chlorella ohadii TaxID=2649997 RepID=A0AAD5DGX1_9CHLO|nr:hypothetical protein COHA_010853 [Chlorella ohadii]